MSLFQEIAAGAAAESPLWASALRPEAERDAVPVFSPLVVDRRFALGVETIYEGYLLHYGSPRLFAPPDDDVGLLLGDALLAHGLVRIADTGSVTAVADLAALLSLCAQARADGRDGRHGAGFGDPDEPVREQRIAEEEPDVVVGRCEPVSYTHLTLPTKA